MIKRRKTAGIVFGLLLISSFAFADTIYFKSGKKVKAEIFEESTYSIKARVQGRPRTFYRYEIDRIEREEAEPSLPAEPMALTEQKKELIRRLLEASGARENIAASFMQIISRAPEELRPEIRELLKTDEVIERLVPVYANYYTEEEVKELIAFYKSPTGQKHLKVIPEIMEDILRETVTYFKEKAAAQKGSPETPSQNPLPKATPPETPIKGL